MLTIEEVKHRLKYMNLMEVSRETGLHSNTIYGMMKGKAPSYVTVAKLSEWLQKIERHEEES